MSAAERFGALARIRSIEEFHPLVSPPGNDLMAVVRELRIYTEESGHEDDPNGEVLALVAYVSELDRWKSYEKDWREVLGDNNVPYLHMKEWWNRDSSIYKHLKADPKKEAIFFRDLAGVIKRDLEFCATSILRLGDFRRFNEDSGLNL